MYIFIYIYREREKERCMDIEIYSLLLFNMASCSERSACWAKNGKDMMGYTYIRTHTDTHTHTYIYIYIYIHI